jgi:peptidoglycan hydrolase CwlO-like protein
VDDILGELKQSTTHIENAAAANTAISYAELRLAFLDEQYETVLEQNSELVQQESVLLFDSKSENEYASAWCSTVFQQNQQSLAELRSVVEGKDTTISEENQQLDTLRGQVALLTSERDQLKKEKLASMEMYTGINREQATHHASEIAQRDTTINTLQSTIDELRDDVAEKQQTVDNLGNSVGLLQNELNVQRLTIVGEQDTIDSQRADMQATRSHHDFIVEMMIQPCLTTINIHKALLRKWANTYRENYEHWAVRKQDLKGELEQQRGVTARLQNQIAAFQRHIWNTDDEVGQLKADRKLEIEILTTEYRARIDEHYEGFRAQFQKRIDDRNAVLGQALTRKSGAQSVRYASALAAA